MKLTFLTLLLIVCAAAQIIPTEKTDIACWSYGLGTMKGCKVIANLICPIDGNDPFAEMASKTFAKTALSVFGSGVCHWAARNHFTPEQDRWVATGRGWCMTVDFGLDILYWWRVRKRDRSRVPRIELLDEPVDTLYGQIQLTPLYVHPLMQMEYKTVPYYGPIDSLFIKYGILDMPEGCGPETLRIGGE